MKRPSLITSCVVAFLALPLLSVEAKPKKKHPPTPAPAEPAADLPPSQQLAPYVTNIDSLLLLHWPPAPAPPLLEGAAGHLAVFKAIYLARQAKAEPAEAASLAAAAATCDALTAALDERQRTVSQISANAAVKGGSDLGRQRKDNFSAGTTGQEFARTFDVIEQAKRERARNQELQKRATATDSAFTQGAVNRWNQRAVELRQQIATLYAKIG
jgi:hypothetical protein